MRPEAGLFHTDRRIGIIDIPNFVTETLIFDEQQRHTIILTRLVVFGQITTLNQLDGFSIPEYALDRSQHH